MSTHTLTALYSDHATAERAAERLRAIGVPEASLEIHPRGRGRHAAGTRRAAASSTLADPLLPREATRQLEAARHRRRRERVPERARPPRRASILTRGGRRGRRRRAATPAAWRFRV